MDNHQESRLQEQTSQMPPTAVPILRWVKPTFEVIEVSLECTAYAGTFDDEE